MGKKCKACGKAIVFARDSRGKAHCLDLAAPIYHLHRDLLGAEVAELAENHYVDHMHSCPHADEISGTEDTRGLEWRGKNIWPWLRIRIAKSA